MRKMKYALAVCAAMLFSVTSFASDLPLDMQIAFESVAVEQDRSNQKQGFSEAVDVVVSAQTEIDESFDNRSSPLAVAQTSYEQPQYKSVVSAYRHEDPHRSLLA